MSARLFLIPFQITADSVDLRGQLLDHVVFDPVAFFYANLYVIQVRLTDWTSLILMIPTIV